MARAIESSRAFGRDVMDNRSRDSILHFMVAIRPIISRLLTLTLMSAVFAGTFGMGGMSYTAPQVEDATAQHQMHDMADRSHDSEGDMQMTDAECAMTICCFADVDGPRADPAGVALKACFAAMAANPALQPAPNRADKPPKRT